MNSKNNKLPVKYVNYSIANRFSDRIELNKDLKQYPSLHKAILKHERSHTNKEFSWHDFMLDLKGAGNRKELFKFIIRRPKTWIQFLPIYYQKKRGWIFDYNLMIIWGLMLLLVLANLLIFIAVLNSW